MAYGDRLTTFEDSEKESEYGYVRKVIVPAIACLTLYVSCVMGSIESVMAILISYSASFRVSFLFFALSNGFDLISWGSCADRSGSKILTCDLK